jgi:hypothetical protein
MPQSYHTSHVESVALYGAEVWGIEKVDKLTSVQSSLYKRILGLGRSTSHYGILRETGAIDKKKLENAALVNLVTVSRQLALHVCSAGCLFTVSRFAYVSGAAFSSLFGYDCGVNIGCRPHVLQTVLFTKMYSIIWLSQNFLCYNSILSYHSLFLVY